MQSTETTFAGLELATQLISHHASIFLGVIILGMNKPRPWKCPWTSSKKRKKRTKNENTAMNEQAKVDGKLKLRLVWDQACKRSESRVLIDKRRFNDSTCSFWLACLLLSNPTCFSPTYQLKSFRRICRKVEATASLGSSLQNGSESRVLIDKGALMIVHVLSGWLASSYPIRRAFLQHIS